MTISQVKINGVLYNYVGVPKGFSFGLIQYDDNGIVKTIKLSEVEEIITT